MICRNCKFSLQGSEKFCPNCGAPLSENPDEIKNEEITLPEAPKIFFTPVRQQEENQEKPKIFQSEDAPSDAPREASEEKISRKSSSKAPVVLMLVLILVVLTLGLFVAVEHFDIAPAIMQYLDGAAADNDKTESTLPSDEVPAVDFQNHYGIVDPNINYAPTSAYVTNNNSLPLRKGPDNSYGLIMSLESGCQLQILGGTSLNDLWVYVYVPFYDCYGWLSASFITLYSNLETTSPSESEASDTTEAMQENKETTLSSEEETTQAL